MYIHFSLTFLLCLLNAIPISLSVRKRWILPFTFILIGIYMGIRYDYGLDYFNYCKIFYNHRNYRPQEFLFWQFFFSFGKYYQYILVKSLLLAAILFYMVRRYVPVKYYALFVFFLMIAPSQIYTMMTAERTCMGAMVLWLGLDFFYLRKKSIPLLVGAILVASLFHTILLSMLIIPIADYFFLKSSKALLTFLLIAVFLGMFIAPWLFNILTINDGPFGIYNHYSGSGRRFHALSLFSAIGRGALLITMYFVFLFSTQKSKIFIKLTSFEPFK